MKFLALIFCVTFFWSPMVAGYSVKQQTQKSIWQIVDNISSNSSELTILREQIAKFPQLRAVLAGVSESYRGEQVGSNITLFAPVNSAFGKLPPALVQALNESSNANMQIPLVGQVRRGGDLMEGLLSYHVSTRGVFLAPQQQQQNATIDTLLNPFNATLWRQPPQFAQQQGPPQLTYNQEQVSAAAQASLVNVTLGEWYVNEANITSGFEASNGFIYLIDGVISPLWFLNQSLSDLPADLKLPNQLVQLAGV
jgi:uncharacterized surface protein with fasciclin (FAS1) repeats